MVTDLDVKENTLYKSNEQVFKILLKDRTTKKNLIWATDNYALRGKGYQFDDAITLAAVTNQNGNLIKPRVAKSKKEQSVRIKTKAEVFTPSWVCNAQNNLVDNSWFGKEGVFNTETEKAWITNYEKVVFPEGKTWQDYVKENRLEITCGEAPYLVSRYDTVTGEEIPVKDRIGLLDRKLRVVSENIDSEIEWYEWAEKAFQSIYGYDWQGDNVLLARENLLETFIDYYVEKFEVYPINEYLLKIAEIISWNIWQMDGLKFVVPNSCHKQKPLQMSLFGEEPEEECLGCKTNNPFKHNGIYCYVMDWETKKKVKFANLIKESNKRGN